MFNNRMIIIRVLQTVQANTIYNNCVLRQVLKIVHERSSISCPTFITLTLKLDELTSV